MFGFMRHQISLWNKLNSSDTKNLLNTLGLKCLHVETKKIESPADDLNRSCVGMRPHISDADLICTCYVTIK